MKLMRNRQSGQILILVLILLALGPLLVIPMLRQGATSLKYHQIIEGDTLNAYSADAGIQNGYYEVYNDPQGIQGANFTETRVINNSTVNVTAEYVPSLGAYRITSTATDANNKSVTIESFVVIDIGLFGNAFAVDGDLIIKNCDLGSDSEGGCDIYANGDLNLHQSTVDGDVVAAGSVTLHETDVSGEVIQGAKVLEFPDIDAKPHRDAAQTGENYTGNLEYKNESYPIDLGPIYIDGYLTLDNSDAVLNGTVYVTGDVIFNKSYISGFGDIVAEGDILFDHFSFNIGEPDILPLVMSTANDVTFLTGQSTEAYDIEAVVYAPSGYIIVDHANIYGSVAGDVVDIDTGQVFYPAAMKGRPDLPGAGLETITYGYK